MISQAATLSIVMGFGTAMFVTGAFRRRSGSADRFLVAERSMGTLTGAMSVASTWIWAPALFIASQKAFQQGLPGLFWFTAPNIGCLIFFAFLARRIQKTFPQGYTFPQYIESRFGKRNHGLYIFTFLSLQVCSLAVQLIAGASLLNAMSGVPYVTGVLMLIGIFTAYSLIDGLKTSVRTDFLQLLIMAVGLSIIVPMAIAKGGGISALSAGLSGFGGGFGNIFDPTVAYSFGITVTIGLMSGPVGDQQHWQRVFAFKAGKAFRAYILSAFIFGLFPLTLSLLGFMAAGNPMAAPMVSNGSLAAQQVGPEVIRTLLPEWGLLVFMVLIIAGLASTGDSALCAGSSLFTVDIYQKYFNPNASSQEILFVSRLAIIGLALVGIGISLIPGITILGLFLFYGTLRSSTLIPTILILYGKHVNATTLFWGITLAIVVGLPLYIAGEFYNNVDVKIIANISILAISLILPYMGSRLKKQKRSTFKKQQKVTP